MYFISAEQHEFHSFPVPRAGALFETKITLAHLHHKITPESWAGGAANNVKSLINHGLGWTDNESAKKRNSSFSVTDEHFVINQQKLRFYPCSCDQLPCKCMCSS